MIGFVTAVFSIGRLEHILNECPRSGQLPATAKHAKSPASLD
jgi:hypothetical protein